MKTVLVIEGTTVHYRVPFFEGLYEELRRCQIALRVAYSDPRRANGDQSHVTGLPKEYEFRRPSNIARLSKNVEGIWPVAFLAFYVLYSLTETTLLSRNDMLWILYVAIAIRVSRPEAGRVFGWEERIPTARFALSGKTESEK